MDVRIGARFRALRHRLGWRQEDLARRAGVSQDVVSLVERGHLERVSLVNLRSIARALDADFVIQLRWRGGDLDRLMDEAHAVLVGATAKLLAASGWLVRIEVSYSVYGERGSIDVLAWHPATATLLVVEVKSELASVEETLRKHDEKARLAPRVASQEIGWRSRAVARLLVLPDLSTPRRRTARHEAVLGAAYPIRSRQLRQWLSAPDGAVSGLLFLDTAGPSKRPASVARKRIRRLTHAG
jgi:transcriptional regulator with XRE-family HTH domain